MMIDHIEITAGNVGWPQAAPLLEAVWPPELVAKLPWRNVVWANPDERLFVFNDDNEIICHLAIVFRDATWDGRAVKVGGIGGVATREDCRRQGVASTAMRRAIREIGETYKADFGLLFCEPRHAPLYGALGWRPFKGDVFAIQPQGRVRFDVTDPFVFDLKISPRVGVLEPLRSPLVTEVMCIAKDRVWHISVLGEGPTCLRKGGQN